MKVIGIIPARYASTRFPGKPLIDIKGKSMIQRVYEGCKQMDDLTELWVATDDQRIYDHVQSFDGNVIMTDNDIPTGTDRCIQALNKIKGDFDAVINIQGDEPLVAQEQIKAILQLLKNGAPIATLKKLIEDQEMISDPNVVKVISSPSQKAIYFSRSPIPFNRDNQTVNYYKHVGLYGFQVNTLNKISGLEKGKLESIESLEQLRWLENELDIYITEIKNESFSIDTPSDLAKFLNKYNDLDH